MSRNYTSVNNSVSIVLPLYNPKGNWDMNFIQDVTELNTLLTNYVVEYIVVHDGPVNELLRAAFERISNSLNNIRFISYSKNKGKGYALRQGVLAANGSSYILMVDFDFPYKKENMVELLLQLKKGKDLVVGRRTKKYFQQVPLKRKVVSKSFSLLNRLFLQLPLYDTQSGLKGFNRCVQPLFLQTTIDRFLVDTEFLLRAYKTNLSIGIIEIDLKPHIQFSNFGIQTFKTELQNFLKLIRLSRKLPPQKHTANSKVIPEKESVSLTV